MSAPTLDTLRQVLGRIPANLLLFLSVADDDGPLTVGWILTYGQPYDIHPGVEDWPPEDVEELGEARCEAALRILLHKLVGVGLVRVTEDANNPKYGDRFEACETERLPLEQCAKEFLEEDTRLRAKRRRRPAGKRKWDGRCKGCGQEINGRGYALHWCTRDCYTDWYLRAHGGEESQAEKPSNVLVMPARPMPTDVVQ